MSAVAVRRRGSVVLAEELGETHRLLVVHLRAAGGMGLTRKEMRDAGISNSRQAIFDLRDHGYRIEARRSKVDGRPWRWVLVGEPPLLPGVRAELEARRLEADRELGLVEDEPTVPPQLPLIDGGES